MQEARPSPGRAPTCTALSRRRLAPALAAAFCGATTAVAPAAGWPLPQLAVVRAPVDGGRVPQAGARPAPQGIDTLRAREFATRLVDERELDPGPGYRARLVSWQVDGLTLRAFVAVPSGARPAAGFPVLVANHGTHPDPPRYGYTAGGVDARPGDYYRAVPALYAAAGFLVVMPDYRGHNSSEGAQFARGPLAAAWFTADVLSLLAGLHELPEADPGNVFLWGHSLGGEVTLRVLLALPCRSVARVRAAALWSTVGGGLWERAAYYGRQGAGAPAGDPARDALAAVDALRAELAGLATPYDWRADEPLPRLAELEVPLLLQHGTGDRGAPYEWSERLAIAGRLAGRPVQLVAVPTSAHWFDGAQREQAVARDVAFFRAALPPPGARRDPARQGCRASMQPLMQDRPPSPAVPRRAGEGP